MAATWPILVGSSITAARSMSGVLAAGLLCIFVLLSVLIWSRFGQAKPVAKCVVLSLLAHVLLLIYAYGTHVLAGPPGRWTGQIVKVRLRQATDANETAPVSTDESTTWQQPGLSDAPLLLTAPPEPAKDAEQPQNAEHLADESSTGRSAAKEPTDHRAGAQHEAPALTDLLDHASGETPATPDPKEIAPNSATESTVHSLTGDTTPLPADDESQNFVAVTPAAPPRRLGDGEVVPESLQARIQANRLQAAQPFGATANSEAAVAAAAPVARSCPECRWTLGCRFARSGKGNQNFGTRPARTGTQADTGVTGLALLAFLGSGETHLSGPHRETVQHGLEFLLASQAADGSLSGNAELFAAMYCHGMAALAFSEAYALSGDERLVPGLQRALHYSIAAQSTSGGWRYRPGEPTDPGDMSQFGWQLMTLKSAEMGGLPMPAVTRMRMVRFLQSCSLGKRRGLAGYRPGDGASRTMTAEALVCRYFLNEENPPAAIEEAASLLTGRTAAIPGAELLLLVLRHVGPVSETGGCLAAVE